MFSAIFKWLFGTSAGRLVLLAIVLTIVASITVARFASWKQGIYDEGYAKGKTDAEALCDEAKRQYFEQAGTMIKGIEAAASAAADRMAVASKETASRVDKAVSTALTRYTKNPMLVYADGKCNFSSALAEDWNALNRATNAEKKP